MTQTELTRWGGLAGAVGGALILVSSVLLAVLTPASDFPRQAASPSFVPLMTINLIGAILMLLGLVALYLFADDIGRLKVFPGAGSYVSIADDPSKWFTSLILPWLVLAASFAAFYARLLRGNLIETMSEDYIRTARAKGLPERRVVLRHGLRAAITPVVTAAGLDIGILLGGAILTEAVFNIPGIGGLVYESIRTADLPMIQGTVLLGAFFIILANLVVDILYAFIDPRVTYA